MKVHVEVEINPEEIWCGVRCRFFSGTSVPKRKVCLLFDEALTLDYRPYPIGACFRRSPLCLAYGEEG